MNHPLKISVETSGSLKYSTPVTIVLWITMVAALSVVSIESIRKDAQTEIRNAMQTVLHFTRGNITDWVNESQRDLATVANSADFKKAAAAIARDGALDTPEGRAAFEKLTEILSHHFGDKPDHRFALALPSKMISLSGVEIKTAGIAAGDEFIGAAMEGAGKTGFRMAWYFPEQKNGAVETDGVFIFSQSVTAENGIVRAALLMGTKLNKNLTHITQLGRIGQTGETYAFNREGLMLSESRFDENLIKIGLINRDQPSALRMSLRDPGGNMMEGYRRSVSRELLPLTRMAKEATRGVSGYDMEGYRDYRGVSVVGAWLWDETLGMGLATEVDLDEAYDSFYLTRRIIIMIMGVTSALTLLLYMMIIGGARQTEILAQTALLANELLRKEAEQREKAEEGLRKSEKRLQSMMDNTTSVIYMKDAEGKYVHANRRFLRLFHKTAEEVAGKTDFDIFPKKTASVFRANDLTVMNTGELLEMEESVPHQDGDHTYISVKFPIYGEDGKLIGISGISTDITERKRAETALKESERRLRRMLEDVNLISVMLDGKGNVTFVNEYLLGLTGYKWEEVVGQNWFDLFIPVETRDGLKDAFAQLIRGERTLTKSYEQEILTSVQERRLVAWNHTELYGLEGGLTGIASLGTDVTEQRRAEAALASSERRFQDVTMNSGDWIWEVDANGRFTYSNQLVEKITGYSAEEIIGRYFWDFMAPEEAKIQRQNFMDYNAVKRPFVNTSSVFIHKSGARVHTEASGIPVIDLDEGFLGFRGATRDVTERIAAERKLKESQDTMSAAQAIAHFGSWDWDIVTNDLTWSDEIYRIFGLEPQQFTPTYPAFLERVHPDDRERVTAAVNDAVAGISEYNIEHRLVHPDGAVRHVTERGEVYRDFDGKPLRMVGVVQDVTERKEAEAARKESEARAQLLLDSTGEAIYGMDTGGKCTFANPACAHALGYESPMDLIGKDMHSLMHYRKENGEPYPQAECGIYRSFKVGKEIHQDGEYFWRRDGSGFPAEYWAYPIKKEGAVTGAVVTFNDITERRAAERALEESQSRLSSFMNSATDIFTLYDQNLRLIEVNDAGLRTFGVKREEVIGKTMAELQLAGEVEARLDKFRDVMRTGIPLEEDQTVSHPVKGTRHILLKVFKSGTGLGMISADITERKNAERELIQSRMSLERAQKVGKMGSWEMNLVSNEVSWSEMIDLIYGFDSTAPQTMDKFWKVVYPEDIPLVENNIREALAGNRAVAVDYRVTHQDGSVHWVRSMAEVFFAPDGRPERMLGVAQDITESKKAEEELHLAAQVFDSSLDGIMVMEASGRIRSANKAFNALTGYSPGEAAGRALDFISAQRRNEAAGICLVSLWNEVTTKGFFRGEFWIRRSNGSELPTWIHINKIEAKSGALEQYVAIFHDITKAKEREGEIQYQAYYDTLTGLPNRALLHDRLKMAVARAKREKEIFALMFLDLDNFKNINDSLGHDVGDLLLKGVSVRLVESLREIDTVARIGGDEFVMLLERLNGQGEAVRVARKIIKALSKSFRFQDKPMYATGSLGITIFPDDGEEVETLLKNADMAMYKAKELGKSGFQMFTADMNEKFTRRLAMENSLRESMEKDAFVVHYQPKMDVKSGAITGMEALVRWIKADGAIVSPAEFIPLAEETGLILRIGETVLRKSLKRLAIMIHRLGAGLRLSVNLSARQFAQGDVVQMVANALRETGVEPELLELEITESSVMQDVDAALAKMLELKKLGVKLSIDDFGTGFSSLGYLRKFPIDVLKIDRSFVMGMSSESADAAIISSIISIGKNLGLKVIAEGVETQAHLKALREMGCDEVQGYLISPPVPENRIVEVIESFPRLKVTV